MWGGRGGGVAGGAGGAGGGRRARQPLPPPYPPPGFVRGNTAHAMVDEPLAPGGPNVLHCAGSWNTLVPCVGIDGLNPPRNQPHNEVLPSHCSLCSDRQRVIPPPPSADLGRVPESDVSAGTLALLGLGHSHLVNDEAEKLEREKARSLREFDRTPIADEELRVSALAALDAKRVLDFSRTMMITALQHLSIIDPAPEGVGRALQKLRDLIFINEIGIDRHLVMIERMQIRDRTEARWTDQSAHVMQDFDSHVRSETSDPERPLGKKGMKDFWDTIVSRGKNWERVVGGKKRKVGGPAGSSTCHLCKGPHKITACPQLATAQAANLLLLVKNLFIGKAIFDSKGDL